jgi:hypothetical protein
MRSQPRKAILISHVGSRASDGMGEKLISNVCRTVLLVLSDVSFHGFSRDGIACPTARTANLDFFFFAEKFGGVVFHRGCKHFEHPLLIASAMPAIHPLFQRHDRFAFFEILHLLYC